MTGYGTTTALEDKTSPGDGKLRVLLVVESPADAELVLRQLLQDGFEVTSDAVQTLDGFTRQVRMNAYQLILADYNLPHWKGMETIEVLRREGLDIPLILVSGALGDVTAVECIKQGAADYVLKGSLARLSVAIRRALQEKRERDQRQQAERNLARKVEELARSNGELEQFAHVASHDLQEPLRMVAAYTQLLGDRYRGKLDGDADKYIGYAVEGAVRMQTLILDLLAFSQAGHNQQSPGPVECNAAFDAAMHNLRRAIEETGAVVTRDNLPALTADSTQLGQLFQNLIGNAIKFRGTEVPAVRISAAKQNDEWRFSVSDNGIGILPQYKDKIFVIFQRLHTREQYSGNGVGLAICRRIVDHYGGRIWVESEPGRGSTFYFTLPSAGRNEFGGRRET